MEINRVVIEEWEPCIKFFRCKHYYRVCLPASIPKIEEGANYKIAETSWTCAECDFYLQAQEPEPVEFYFRTTSIPAKYREMIQGIL